MPGLQNILFESNTNRSTRACNNLVLASTHKVRGEGILTVMAAIASVVNRLLGATLLLPGRVLGVHIDYEGFLCDAAKLIAREVQLRLLGARPDPRSTVVRSYRDEGEATRCAICKPSGVQGSRGNERYLFACQFKINSRMWLSRDLYCNK